MDETISFCSFLCSVFHCTIFFSVHIQYNTITLQYNVEYTTGSLASPKTSSIECSNLLAKTIVSCCNIFIQSTFRTFRTVADTILGSAQVIFSAPLVFWLSINHMTTQHVTFSRRIEGFLLFTSLCLDKGDG